MILNEKKTIIREFLNNHPVYGEGTTEEEKDQFIETITDDMSMEQIDEMVDVFMGGLASGGTNYGYGGMGTGTLGNNNRQGIRVYGYDSPNGMTPGDGHANMHGRGTDDEPAIVVVPPKESTYEPWKTELTPSGYRKNDVERNQVETDFEKNENEIDILLALENYGYDANELMEMSQEELEEILKKVVMQAKKQQGLKESVNYCQGKTIKNILLESFTKEPEEMLLEKRFSRIALARELLASRHQIKDAITKKPNSRAYVIDRFKIESMMIHKGYIWSDLVKNWVKKPPKPKKKQEYEPEVSKPRKAETYEGPKPTKKDDESSVKKKSSYVPLKKDDDSEDEEIETKEPPKEEPKDFSEDPERKDGIKDYQGRYLLATVHNMLSFVRFTFDDETQKYIPEVDVEDVDIEMEQRGYIWYDDDKNWLNEELTFPDTLFEKGDSRRSLIARSYLASFGDHEYIEYDEETRLPLRTADESEQALKERGYLWDSNALMWVFSPDDNVITEVILNEAAVPKVKKEKPITVKDKNMKNYPSEIAYSSELVKEGLARFLLRVIQYKNAVDTKSDVEYKDLDKDPTFLKSDTIFQVHFDDVVEELTKQGYSLNQRKVPYYSDTKDVPRIIQTMTKDTERSFLARGILFALDNKKTKKQYLTIESDPLKTPTIKATVNKGVVEDKVEQNKFVYDDDGAYIKHEFKDREVSRDEQPLAVKSDRQYHDLMYADYDTLDFGKQTQFKDMLADKKAMSALGYSTEEWSKLSSYKRGKEIKKFKTYYKWDKSSKNYVKRPHPLPIRGDYFNVRAAIGTVLRTIGGTIKTALALSNLLSGIDPDRKAFDPTRKE